MPIKGNRRPRISPDMLSARQDGGIPVGKVIARWIASLGLQEQARLGRLESEWGDAVGAALAVHTRPGALEKGELTVFVDHSTWLSEIQRYANTDLLAKIQARFGSDSVRRIRLRLDPGR